MCCIKGECYKKGFLNNDDGFTLIELIVAMAVMAIFMGMLVSILMAGGRSFKLLDDDYKAENEARIAMSYMTTQIRQNDAVTTTGGGLYVHNVQVVREASDNILMVTDEDGTRYIYTSDTGEGGRDLMESQTAYMDPNGNIISENLYSVGITTSSALTGNTKITIAIRYGKNGGKKLEESVTLRAEED